MPITPTYPGVYVQEVPSGVRTIVGVSTSIAVFIGRAKQGPLNEPVLCLNYTDFERVFSSEYAGSDMARAVRLFFMNGGTQCYVMRIADGATQSSVTLQNESGTNVLKVTAKSPGLVGDTIRLAVTYNGLHPESTFNLEIFRWAENSVGSLVKTDIEKWTALSMDPGSSRYVVEFVNQNSTLVELEDKVAEAVADESITIGSGYSQSGRAIPNATDEEFAAKWRELLFGIGPAVEGTPWNGTSGIISTSGTYSGTSQKTFTFAIQGAGTLTIGSVDILINCDDGSGGPVIPITIPSGPTANDSISVAEDLLVAFGTGDLEGGEQFSVDVSPLFLNSFRISVDGGSPVEVDLSLLTDTHITSSANLEPQIQTKINDALLGGPQVGVTFEIPPQAPPNNTMLRITSAGQGDVRIEPSSSNDLAVPMMLGTAQGGIEISRYAQYRPAPTGIVFNMETDLANLIIFADLEQQAFNTLTINSTDIDLEHSLETTNAADKMYQDVYPASVTGNSDGVREKWSIIADKIDEKISSDPTFKWSAEVWGLRLALIPGDGGENSQGSIVTSGGGGTNISSHFIQNVRYYSLGTSGQGDFQDSGVAGSDGSAPTLPNYRDAFKKLDKEVDLFNLMILPTDGDHSESEIKNLWGPASVFCQKRRAFLLMDSPTSWGTVQMATNSSTGVNSLRVGLVKDHSAIFYPRVTINENGLKKNVGPSGAIAGLMARIDGTRGVWKAPAGTEADLRGIVGVEYKFSDDENGVLNPRAINTLRVFPNGIVNWGARTMDGDDDFGSEYKYIPVRRLALYMEESLYRGLKWVVFEPNDEPLWSQIRLNVGAFMHNLFRQGAFQGQTPKDAYFVKCDKETTTQNDINLGIVNIWVGFAPLKPAEFVILYLQQMAGQIEV
jgi:phage tail sheath protein FI